MQRSFLARLKFEIQEELACEADAYDQQFLIRLKLTHYSLPRRVELIKITLVLGFIGMGQLAPDLLRSDCQRCLCGWMALLKWRFAINTRYLRRW